MGQMQEVASNVMGKAKAAKASIKGLEGIFKRLTQEHGEVSALLMRVSMSSDPDVRAEYFPKIRKELLAHERGELKELYPLLEQKNLQGIVTDHNRESEKMESLIERLDGLSVDSDTWKQVFDELVQTVQHHTSEEESEYFPKAQQVLGAQKAKELEQSYLRQKETILQQL